MSFFAAAYATTPCSNAWDPALEHAFYKGLAAIDSLRGLEVPFTGTLHPFDETWLLNAMPSHWDVVLTLLPGTMDRLGASNAYGLASDDAEGRAAALRFTSLALRAVNRLNDHAGRQRVTAVELHSAPRRGGAVTTSKASFAASLTEIASWDWQGASLMVEHCDAWTPDLPPIKGFMTLGEEIAAITQANVQGAAAAASGPIGVVLNWGRSVLEVRDPAQPLRHIRDVRRAGLPLGLIFSGCSGQDTPWGVWQDSHMPHAPSPDLGASLGAEGSLLTAESIAAALAEAGPDLRLLGGKLTARPADADPALRAGLNRDLLTLISRALEKRSA